MLRTILISALFLLCLCVTLPLLADEAPAPAETPALAPLVRINPRYVVNTEHLGSRVNWLTGQLEAVGIAFANSAGAIPRVQARANAADLMRREARKGLLALPVDGTRTVRAAVEDEAGKQACEKVLNGLTVVEERWDPRTRKYTVIAVLPFYGEQGATSLGLATLKDAPPVTLAEEQVLLKLPVPRGRTPQRFDAPYTGIIINGDSVLLTPCLFPRLLRFDGKEFWGPSTLTPSMAVDGPVRYLPNLQAALDSGLAGERPLVLDAVGTGQDGYYPVLNLDDVYTLLLQQRDEKLLSRSQILVTLGQR